MNLFFDPSVCIIDCKRHSYPPPPFHPPQPYPEYPFGATALQPDNFVYEAVRTMLYRLGLDADHFGTPSWNPLGAIIRPGDKVVLKPNLVISEHELGVQGIEASTVHGSVIRPFLDYTWIALQGEGRITIGDAPIKEVDFDKITTMIGIRSMLTFFQEHHPDLPVELVDYRDLRAWRRADGTIVDVRPLPGDSRGYTVIDLKHDSMFHEVAHLHKRFRSTAAVYENVVQDAHTRDSHKYSFANSVLDADVFICLAKMKTHRKAGVTLSLKNLVGLTNEKRWLPHHRLGTVAEGGDMLPADAPLSKRAAEALIEYCKASRLGRFWFSYILPPAAVLYRRVLANVLEPMERGKPAIDWGEGDWHGNDTVWRMVLDLNHILLFTDKNGRLHDTPQRRYFSCIDGIVAGHREGPLHPTPMATGLLVGGFNPVAVDLACIRLMGYDFRKIPLMTGIDRMPRKLIPTPTVAEFWQRLRVVSTEPRYERLTTAQTPFFSFDASAGWKGHIELDTTD